MRLGGTMRPLLRHKRLLAAAATVSAYALLRWLRRKRLRRALAPAHPSWRDSAQAQLIGSTPLLPLHSLSKLWGDGATDGLRFSVGMYVPLKTMCAVAKRLRST